jgi:LPS-assembly lipoprotein
MIRAALLGLALLPLSACGFSPVYGSLSERADAGPVDIKEIENAGRAGHFLRQELVRTVGQGIPGVKGQSTLEVVLALRVERLAFTPDQAASRSDYVGAASWSLRDAKGTVLQTGETTERASFNFADSAYADVAAQAAAQERLAMLLSRAIREKLFLNIGNAVTAPAAKPAILPPTPGVTTTRAQVIPQ